MKSDRLRPSASAARSIRTFCFCVARRLIVSPRPPTFFFAMPAKNSLHCVYVHYTHTCARCKYNTILFLPFSPETHRKVLILRVGVFATADAHKKHSAANEY